MRYLTLCLVPLVIALTACSAGDANAPVADGLADQALQIAADDEAAISAVEPDQAQTAAGDQYQLLGIKDAEFNMVAAAVKIPRGWLAKQSFQRVWNGAMPVNTFYMVFRSPDGKQQVEYMPASHYSYSDGPWQNNSRMQMQSMGLPSKLTDDELAPMTATAYLRGYVLPQMAQNGATLRSTGNERETPPHREEPPSGGEPRMASSASLDGVLPNGNQARVEVRINWFETHTDQGNFYTWWATPTLTQTAAEDLEATYAHTETARTSIAYNPEWLRKDRELMQKSDQAAMQAIRSRHTAAMENIAQWGRISRANSAASLATIKANAATNAHVQDNLIASSNARMAENERSQELYTDNVINSETKFSSAETGERVKLDNRYNHTYTDNAGGYLQSNEPLQPGNVDWQEMDKVPFNDY